MNVIFGCSIKKPGSINQGVAIILETAVGRDKDVQDIGVHGGFEKRVVTLLVMSAFSNSPGASRACADFRDPTAVSRIMPSSSPAFLIYQSTLSQSWFCETFFRSIDIP
jgi:hypothetical protein